MGDDDLVVRPCVNGHIRGDIEEGRVVCGLEPASAAFVREGDIKIAKDAHLVKVPAGSRVTIDGSVRHSFRPMRIHPEGDLDGSIDVEDIKVGNKSQFVSCVPVPIESVDSFERFDAVPDGVSFSIDVHNRSKNAKTIGFVLEGFVCDDADGDKRAYPRAKDVR